MNTAIDDTTEADHNDDKMFAIYEKHEIEEIIRYLKWALDGCKEG